MRKGLFVAVLLLMAIGGSRPLLAQGFCPAESQHAKVISGTTYSIGQADYCNVLTFTSASPVAATLPAPGTAGGYTLGYWVTVFMEGTGSLTVTPQANAAGVTPTINGLTTLTRASAGSATIYVGTDGKYYATLN